MKEKIWLERFLFYHIIFLHCAIDIEILEVQHRRDDIDMLSSAVKFSSCSHLLAGSWTLKLRGHLIGGKAFEDN